MSPNGSDRSSRRPMRRRILPPALLAGLVLATATGCTSEDFPRLGMPTPVTEEAPRILSLWQGSWAAALATGALVWGLILWSVFFHRRSRTKVEVPPQNRYNLPIEALYTLVPIIIVSVLFYFTARDQSELLKNPDRPKNVVNVVAFQWSWAFNYIQPVGEGDEYAEDAPELSAIPDRFEDIYPENSDGVHEVGTPAQHDPDTGDPGPTLYLPVGEETTFIITSRDVNHSFWVLPFLMKMDAIPGHTNSFTVTPTQEGTFRGKCAELCGTDHSSMLFNVKVVSPEEYDAYLQSLADEGQTGYVPAGIAQTDAARNAETNEGRA
ncbi:cytochrome c oxidase subunit II [Streptomyces sp. RFCAC02]|uniref:aa3-type cytochrome oxidase subunit II n=1 Tax=Streptomyces sp. RFCAC02 TaxID=2499143 RepID=UPI00101EC167|nr:cytochrome c oxidase subunit II [Streptomyces sp. RFCAC02]